MTRDDDDERSDIDFVHSDDPDGADEDLVLPPQRALPGTVRQRYVAAVVLVLLVLGGVALHGRRSTPNRSAAAKPTTASAPTIPAPSPPGGFVTHLGDRNGSLRNDIEVSVPRISVPPSCPQAGDGQAACTAVHTVPRAFLAAVRERFPTARQTSTLTEQVRPAGAEIIHGLWSRTFTARIGAGQLSIVVRPGGDDDSFPITSASSDNGRSVLAYSHHETKSYIVELQVSGPSGNEPSLRLLTALCSDPRLVQVD